MKNTSTLPIICFKYVPYCSSPFSQSLISLTHSAVINAQQIIFVHLSAANARDGLSGATRATADEEIVKRGGDRNNARTLKQTVDEFEPQKGSFMLTAPMIAIIMFLARYSNSIWETKDCRHTKSGNNITMPNDGAEGWLPGGREASHEGVRGEGRKKVIWV